MNKMILGLCDNIINLLQAFVFVPAATHNPLNQMPSCFFYSLVFFFLFFPVVSMKKKKKEKPMLDESLETRRVTETAS